MSEIGCAWPECDCGSRCLVSGDGYVDTPVMRKLRERRAAHDEAIRRAAYLECAEMAEQLSSSYWSGEGASACDCLAARYRQMAEGKEP